MMSLYSKNNFCFLFEKFIDAKQLLLYNIKCIIAKSIFHPKRQINFVWNTIQLEKIVFGLNICQFSKGQLYTEECKINDSWKLRRKECVTTSVLWKSL